MGMGVLRATLFLTFRPNFLLYTLYVLTLTLKSKTRKREKNNNNIYESKINKYRNRKNS